MPENPECLLAPSLAGHLPNVAWRKVWKTMSLKGTMKTGGTEGEGDSGRVGGGAESLGVVEGNWGSS